MSALDWILTLVPLIVVIAISLYTQRYMKSVAGFLSGERTAGRYLLAVAKGEMQAGVIIYVAAFELYSKSGFSVGWWSMLTIPFSLVVAVSGFVIYRFRETRALTLGQYFEIRYSRRFRLFAGALCFLAGILNFGITPIVGARFFVFFLQLPQMVHILSWDVQTSVLLMALFLGISLTITLSGGVITLMVADCVEGIFSQIFYIAIVIAVLCMVKWSQIADVLSTGTAGRSLIDPLDGLALKDFNIWYVLMGFATWTYSTMGWQNTSAYNSAGKSPHDTRMAGILGRWRESGKTAVVALLALGSIAFLRHPDFSVQASQAYKVIDQIGNSQVREQMFVPVGLSYLLPIGVKGLLCVVLLMGVFGGDATHLHSWGGIFVQDVIIPLRKKPLSTRQHIRLLRLSVLGVALFAFLFGSLFRQTEYIYMWWQVTQSVFLSGAGAVIIGGLYWKKGSTTGAWAAVLTGTGLSMCGIVFRQLDPTFPLNGIQISFFASLIAASVYGVVSWLTSGKDYDMDRLLHRGRYTNEANSILKTASPVKLSWAKIIGFDQNFTRSDKWIAGGFVAWSMFYFTVFAVVTSWNLIFPWSNRSWAAYWRIHSIAAPVTLTVITAVWFTWGGARDIRDFFRRLRSVKTDARDNGALAGEAGVKLDTAARPAESSTLPAD